MIPDLWDHQREAIELALHALDQGGGFGLWHDMRCGKCRTTLEILQRIGARRTLVVCPKKVIGVWTEQARRWGWEGASIALEGPSTKRAQMVAGAEQWLHVPAIFVTNHEGVWREPLATEIKKIDWDVLVVDEAHRLKAPRGKAARFLWSLAKTVPRRLALSGTPIPHSPLDAWGVYRVIEPEAPLDHSTYTRFRIAHTRRATYSEYHDRDLVFLTGRGGQPERYKLVGLDALNDRMYHRNGLTIAHRKLAEDVLDLAEPLDIVRYVELEPAARRVYRELERELVAILPSGEETVSAGNALTVMLRLAQITGGTVRRDDGENEVVSTAKLETLTEMLEDSDEPVVVFCRFHSDLDAVHEAAGDILELSGRHDELAQWQAGDAQVFAVQIQAGGIGIDLSRARMAIFYSLGYSLSDYLQARARLVADGLKTPPAFYHLVARGTVDEAIYEALDRREEVMRRVVEGLQRSPAERGL